MTAWARAGVLLVGSLLLAGPARAADPAVPGTTLFTFRGDDVYESSGLVDRGDVVYTNNDSGDDAVIYGVDPRTGRTVSRTTYAGSVEDVEAIAPGPDGTVWAGDIGDNLERRDDVSVYRVTPGHDGDAPRYRLAYPDGAHNAEALLRDPRSGRLLVVSKSVFGGTVYAAPRRLREGDRPNRLRVFARVGGLVTDGAFFPDGRHVVIRTYGTASVYTYPGFDLVGTVRLPAQRQGEAISVSATGRVLVSSEGALSDVLRVRLPGALTDPSPSATPSPGPAPSTSGPPPVADGRPVPRTTRDWLAAGLVGLGVVGLGWLAVRASRMRR